MRVNGRVVVESSPRGVADVMVSVVTLEGKGCSESFPDALLHGDVRCWGATQCGPDGSFSIDTRLDGRNDGCCQRAYLVVETPRLLSNTQCGERQERFLQALEIFIGGPRVTLRVPVPATRLVAAGLRADSADDLRTTLAAAWSTADKQREVFGQAVGERFQSRLLTAASARAHTTKLSAAPLPLRQSGLLARDGAELEKATALAKKRTSVRFTAYAARARPHIRLWRAEQELAGHLNVSVPDLNRGIVLNGSVCDLLHLKGPELTRVRSLLDEVPAPAAPEPPLIDGEPEVDEELTMEAALQRAVRQRIDALTAPKEKMLPIDGLRRVEESVKGFALPAGPADAVAYHDFHSLQIAFEHVWVEAFDADLRARVEELYGAVVELHEEYGIDAGWVEDIDDIAGLDSFLRESDRRRRAIPWSEPPDDVIAAWPTVSFSAWNQLSCAQKTNLGDMANDITDSATTPEDRARLRREGLEVLASPQGPLLRVEKLMLELRERLAMPHAFHYFAPNSVNYGLLLTYRQRWTPESYQVGRMVSSVPLAPGETRRFRVVQKVEQSRSERQLEASLRALRDSNREARRAEAEVVRRARTTTNFQQTVQGALSFGLGQIGGSTMFGINQAVDSANTKRNIRESVRDAAQEYRDERRLEVEMEETEELESETTRTISNPNDEVAVTYLFYELERRYRVSEGLHRLTPVVMVAQDVPAPHEIDDDWLLAHEWILRRVLLDDSFNEALDLLRSGFVGEEAGVEIAHEHWRAQKEIVDSLRTSLASLEAAHASLEERLVSTMLDKADAEAMEPDEVSIAATAFATGGWSLLFGEGDAASERFEAMRKALELRLEQLDKAVAKGRSDLKAEATLLERAQQAYTEALRKQMDRRTLVDQLRVHVKENILFYMHAIWDHEPSDQRFFRLYHVEVPVPNPPPGGCRLRPATDAEIETRNVIERDGRLYVIECAPPDPDDVTRKPLGEIADLDFPLGFKGNYIIFRLRECVHLTDFMMQEYIDDYLGIRDPDELGEFSTEELVELRRRAGSTLPPAERSRLDVLLAHRLAVPQLESERVILPTGQLMIEALPGTHPVLERFKHVHRALDLVKVENELRLDELETLRYAARLVAGTLEDPEVDRRVVIEGADVTVGTDV